VPGELGWARGPCARFEIPPDPRSDWHGLMNKPYAPLRVSSAWRIAAISGAGTAGLGISAVFTHDRAGLILAGTVMAAAALTSGAAKVVKQVYRRRPDILRARGEAQARAVVARGDAEAQRITAQAEAQALLIRTTTRSLLLLAGTEPSQADSATVMLRQQSVDPDLPLGRRLNDNALTRLLTPPEPCGSGDKPRLGPAGAAASTRSGRHLVVVRGSERQGPARRQLHAWKVLRRASPVERRVRAAI
jgi:hypothetical protein